MKHGVPFDVAFAMVEGGMMAHVYAWLIMCGEMEGGTWNWRTLEWEKEKD